MVVIHHPTLEVSNTPIVLTALLYIIENFINAFYEMCIVGIHPVLETLSKDSIEFVLLLNCRDSMCEAIAYKFRELSSAYPLTIR